MNQPMCILETYECQLQIETSIPMYNNLLTISHTKYTDGDNSWGVMNVPTSFVQGGKRTTRHSKQVEDSSDLEFEKVSITPTTKRGVAHDTVRMDPSGDFFP